MSYLNWKEKEIKVEMLEHPRFQKELRVKIPLLHLNDFLASLKGVYEGHEKELRWDLTDQWTLFWKVRDDENRALLAHPEPDRWIATFALEKESAAQWISALSTLSVEKVLFLSQSLSLARISNLEFSVTSA